MRKYCFCIRLIVYFLVLSYNDIYTSEKVQWYPYFMGLEGQEREFIIAMNRLDLTLEQAVTMSVIQINFLSPGMSSSRQQIPAVSDLEFEDARDTLLRLRAEPSMQQRLTQLKALWPAKKEDSYDDNIKRTMMLRRISQYKMG